MNYLVIPFLDLNDEEYLRVIMMFKEICENNFARNISVIAYITGHGHFSNHNEFLIPIDAGKLVHLSKHKLNPHDFAFSCLKNLMEIFYSDPIDEAPSKKYSVVVFWDLCRSELYYLIKTMFHLRIFYNSIFLIK